MELLRFSRLNSERKNMSENSPAFKNNSTSDIDDSLVLTTQEKRSLLEFSRRVLTEYVTQMKIPEIVCRGRLDTIKRGVFVSLYKNDHLRGCIGYIEPIKSCLKAVRDNTVSAAVNDPRFPPVSSDELDDVKIEISVLTPPVKVESWCDIEIGRHGIILEKGGCRSVFLPQVPVEQNWNLKTTLSYLAMKAGLPRDAWLEDTCFKVFEAQVINEKAGV
jgi:AmmeMemoRadiSam system protein A